MPAGYLRLSFLVEPGSEERLSAELWQRGTLGVELCEQTRSVVAYFPDGAVLTDVEWHLHGGRLLAAEPLADQDWLAGYRLAARPIALGRRLLVDPGEPRDEPHQAAAAELDGRILLRLPARTAFGTGSHASTRLAVELLDDLAVEGLEVLDVGFGSGVLSFAAHLAGAAKVVGVEIDGQAALVGGQNRALNGLWPAWLVGGVRALRPEPLFDLALVNVLPERIADDLGEIHLRLRAGGRAIFSGILTEAAASVVTALRGCGFEPRERRSSEEWSAFLVEATLP
jgi:ribosomal protein L11 methyltransferase